MNPPLHTPSAKPDLSTLPYEVRNPPRAKPGESHMSSEPMNVVNTQPFMPYACYKCNSRHLPVSLCIHCRKYFCLTDWKDHKCEPGQ